MTDTPRAAGIYCRLSYAPDGSLEKVERQEADCREVAARLRWPVSESHIFHDNNRSAWQRNRRRPGWDAMLEAIETGQIDAIIVYHGDRLIRQPYDLEKLINVADSKGIRIASVTGTRNLDSPDDRFILRIEAAQACRESDNISRRVRRGWAARAKKGYPIGGGKRPFGFEDDYITRREDECAVLAGAVERLLAGQSIAGVLRWMNERSTTSQGNRWNSRSLHHILERPRIAGLIEHDGNLYPAVWEPIISVEAWQDVKLLLRTRAEQSGFPGSERRYLLSGIATCPTGHPLRTKPSGGRNRKTARIYWCTESGCPTRVGRNVDHLDAYVTGRVLQVLQDPEFIASVTAPDESVGAEIVRLERRKAAVKEQLENLAELDEVDPVVLAKSLASFDRKIAELRAKAEMSERQRLLTRVAGISRQQWDDLPIDVRSSVVRALYRVTVLPTTQRGPGFDPSAVRLELIEDE
jgi:site-specific DNA recombinase